MVKYIKRWTQEMEDMLGTKPDEELAALWGVPIKVVTGRRHRLRIRPYPARLNKQLFEKGVRICYKCGKIKPLSEFKKHPGCYDGLMTQCRKCEEAKRRERRRANKQHWVNLMGGRCTRCGYNECLSGLDFHHVNGDPTYEKSSSWIVDASRVKFNQLHNELDKCILLCSCCHNGLHAGEIEIKFTKRDDLGWTVIRKE